MGILRRQLALAALNANAFRPPHGLRSGMYAFAAGWLTTELAPQLLGLTALDAATHARPGPGGRTPTRTAGLALAAVNATALGVMVAQAHGARRRVEDALVESLGVDYVEQLDQQPTPADRALPWRQLAMPFRVRTPGVHVERDIAYADAGRRTMLDVYSPTEPVHPDGAPVLIQVHGGAWRVGSKETQAVPLMQHMAAKGWVCVAINYRLAPKDPWPAHIIDVKRAIAWVREHISAYGGDPSYLAITGGSAGGHLTALAALTPGDPAYQPGFEDADTHVDVAVPHYGVYDFAGATGLPRAVRMRDRFLGPLILKKRFREDPEVFEAASPLLRITPDAPDFLVLHGTADSLVDVEQGRLFARRLREVSRRSVVYAELPGAHHAFDTIPSVRSAHVVRAVDRYLHWHWNGWRGRPVGESPAELAEEQA
ncbi:alpha/beta hydrolase [Nocardioides zeae]|uniref:Alpha/beta hydrolase n=1 Tax=Nocardioides imazamoxiresistens TaxID=3231893 RepID=A0ABU3PT98_9ACTN|nr:alpha/beta hydrolase [Nocardioides zeae]MDT9592460.1 alpha/beta hydrolase [Nocardioides zeae]